MSKRRRVQQISIFQQSLEDYLPGRYRYCDSFYVFLVAKKRKVEELSAPQPQDGGEVVK